MAETLELSAEDTEALASPFLSELIKQYRAQDMHGAWELLPGALRRDIAGLSIKHAAVYAAAGRQRPGTTAPAGG